MSKCPFYRTTRLVFDSMEIPPRKPTTVKVDWCDHHRSPKCSRDARAVAAKPLGCDGLEDRCVIPEGGR